MATNAKTLAELFVTFSDYEEERLRSTLEDRITAADALQRIADSAVLMCTAAKQAAADAKADLEAMRRLRAVFESKPNAVIDTGGTVKSKGIPETLAGRTTPEQVTAALTSVRHPPTTSQ